MKIIFRMLSALLSAIVIGGCGNSVNTAATPQEIRIVQICDTQLGMKNYKQELANLKMTVEQINQLKPDAVIVCGDLVNQADANSFADFNAAVKPLKVPLYCVPGNHDIGNHPTTATMALYKKTIGEDHYTVDVKRYRVIVVNSMLWKYPSDLLSIEQDAWLKKALQDAAAAHHPVIIAGHCPLFVKNMEEKDEYFNVPLEKRRELLALFAANEVDLMLFGHTHTSFQKQVNNIMIVNGPTTSVNFDKKPYAFNLITISPPNIKVETINLSDK